MSQDNLYINLSLLNNDATNNEPIPCVINESFAPILKHQNEYNVSLEYFQLKQRLPLMICPIKEGNSADLNLTPFGICYTFNNVNYSSPIIYNPAVHNTANYINSLSLPKTPINNNGKQDKNNSYYNIYEVNDFLTLINTASEIAFNALKTANPAIPQIHPIEFIYDSNSNKISVIAQYSYREGVSAVDFFINVQLRNVIDSLQGIFNGYNNSDFRDFKLTFKHDSLFNTNGFEPVGTAIANPPSFIKNEAECKAVNLLTTIKGLLIKSNAMSVKNEYLPKLNIQNEIVPTNIGNFNPPSSAIITYHEFLYSDTSQRTENIYYLPSYEQYINLTGTGELTQLNISVDLVLRGGEVIPFQLTHGGEFAIKIKFSKKDDY